jgi:hypothetical protein
LLNSFNPDKIEPLTGHQILEAEIIIEKMHPLTGEPIRNFIPTLAWFGCSYDSITKKESYIDNEEDSDCSVIENNNLYDRESTTFPESQ